MSNILASLSVRLLGDIGGFVESMDKAVKTADSAGSGIAGKLGGALATVGKAAAGFAVAGVAALGTAMIGGITANNAWAGSLDSIGDVIGTTADESAAIAVAIRGVGGDVGAITGQFAKLATNVYDAKGGLGPAGLEMQKLGIRFQDAHGKLLPSYELAKNISDRFAQMPDGLEKTDAMMALLGKTGKDMGDSLNAMANGGLEAARQKAQALGLAVGEGGVNQSLAMGRAMADLEMVGQGLAVSLGTTLMPVLVPLIQKFAEWAISVMPQVRDIVTRVGEVIGQLVEGVTKGTGPMGELGSVAQTVFTTIRTVIEDVVKWVTKNWPEIQRVAGAVFAAIDNVIQTVVVPVLAFLAEQFGVVVSWVTENWPLIQATAEKVFNAIKAVIVVVAPVLEQVIGGTFNSIKAVIETVLGTVLGIIKTAMQLINGDWEGAWSTIKGVVEGIWTGIKNFFGGLPAQVLQFGINIITGLVDGIRNSASMVLGALSDVVNNAINGVKATLGIHSPSTVFAGFGENMMRGLADGIDSFGSLPTVSVRGVVGGFTGNATATGSAPANPFSRAGITISQIIIQASSEGEGRAAARGFAEELTRRGLLPVGV